MTLQYICVDSSFIVRLITAHPSTKIYNQLWQQWMTENVSIIAPNLLAYEITNALHRLNNAGQILETEIQPLLTEALNLPIQFHGNLHHQAIAIAQTYNLPATYDAHYLALSQQYQADLYTCDKRLFNSVKASLDWVHLVEE